MIIVPHLVSPFTESLDPIKAYECLAVDTPTVATPVAGFREHAKELNIADRAVFVTRVGEVLAQPIRNARSADPVSWDARSNAFEAYWCEPRLVSEGTRLPTGEDLATQRLSSADS